MNYDDVRQSFHRALVQNPRLIHRFYEIFLVSHPAIGPKFAKTNFESQIKLLRHGIGYAIAFANMPPGSTGIPQENLRRIRDSHSRTALNIDPALYPFWTESLVRTIRESDNKFDAILEQRWREVLGRAVQFIVSGYEKKPGAAA